MVAFIVAQLAERSLPTSHSPVFESNHQQIYSICIQKKKLSKSKKSILGTAHSNKKWKFCLFDVIIIDPHSHPSGIYWRSQCSWNLALVNSM